MPSEVTRQVTFQPTMEGVWLVFSVCITNYYFDMEKQKINNQTNYYRIATDSNTGKLAQNLLRRYNECNNAASFLAKDLGATSFTLSQQWAAGGIGSLLFNRPHSAKKYDFLGKEGKYYVYVPNTSTAQGWKILERIASLPIVKMKEELEIFGIPASLKYAPVWFRYGESIYLSINGWDTTQMDFTPISDEEFMEARNGFENEEYNN